MIHYAGKVNLLWDIYEWTLDLFTLGQKILSKFSSYKLGFYLLSPDILYFPSTSPILSLIL